MPHGKLAASGGSAACYVPCDALRLQALAGMIEEHARHMGHVDLLRERIDGRIGQ